MPLAVLEQDFVRMSELAPQVQDDWRLLQTLQVRSGQLLMFMGGSNAGQANVIDRAVWSCQLLGLLEILADDIQQNVNEVATIRCILHPDCIEERLEGLVVSRDRVCIAAKLLRHPVQLVRTNECLLAIDINASRASESRDERI